MSGVDASSSASIAAYLNSLTYSVVSQEKSGVYAANNVLPAHECLVDSRMTMPLGLGKESGE